MMIMKRILIIDADDELSAPFPFRSNPVLMDNTKHRMELECKRATSIVIFTGLPPETCESWLKSFFATPNLNVIQVNHENKEEMILKTFKAFCDGFPKRYNIQIVVYSNYKEILDRVDHEHDNSVTRLYLIGDLGGVKSKYQIDLQEKKSNELWRQRHLVQEEFKKLGLDTRKVTSRVVKKWHAIENGNKEIDR